MRTVTIREAREGLSHPEQLFATDNEVIVTRRGKPVAMLLSLREYHRLTAQTQGFWAAYSAFAEAVDLPRLKIEPHVFEAVRDRSRGREVNW